MPAYEVSSYQAHVAPVWPDSIRNPDDSVGIGRLVVCVRQPALEAPAHGKAQIQLWLMSPHSGVSKEGVITAWNDNSNEWSQGCRPPAHIVLQSDPEVLYATVIISVVNGKLMRLRAI